MRVWHSFNNPVADEPGFIGVTPSIWNASGSHTIEFGSSDVTGALGYTPVPTTRAINTTSPLQGGGDLSSDRTLSIPQATGTQSGYLSGPDWVTFNSKQGAISFPITPAQGGTGVINTGTFTNHSNSTIVGGGTISLGGFTLTIPATGTAALLARNNIFTRGQMVDGSQDEIQLRVQGHNTQTNYLQTWENVTGTVHAFMQNNGYFQDYGHSAFGANSNVNNPGQTHYPGYSFDVSLSAEVIVSLSSDSVDFIEGSQSYLTVNPSASGLVASYFGFDAQAWTEVGNDKDINYVTGIYGTAAHQGTGLLNYLNGLEYFTGTGGDGDIGRMIGAHVYADHYYAGDVDEMVGALIEIWRGGTFGTRTIGVHVINSDDGGTAPLAYGILIDDVDSATTNYSIYTGAGNHSLGGNLFLRTIKSGATQVAAGAVANEVWKTNGHATLPNNVLMIGV